MFSERAVGAGQRPRGDEVHHDADQRDDQDRGALDLGRVDHAAHALDDDEQPEDQQRRAVELGREDLGALEAEGEGAARGAAGEVDRDQRQRDRGGVGEHVRRVGEQRQRRGGDADGDLDGHEAQDQPEGDRELAAVGVLGDLVAVPVAGAGAVVCVIVAVAHGHKASLCASAPSGDRARPVRARRPGRDQPVDDLLDLGTRRLGVLRRGRCRGRPRPSRRAAGAPAA